MLILAPFKLQWERDGHKRVPQKPPKSAISELHRGVKNGRKSKILVGFSGRTRTYNPLVNSNQPSSRWGNAARNCATTSSSLEAEE